MAPGCACGRVSWHGRTVPGSTVAVRSCCGPLVRRWSGPADHAGRAGCARPDPQVTATGRPVHPARWSPGRCRSPDQNERVGTQDRAAGWTPRSGLPPQLVLGASGSALLDGLAPAAVALHASTIRAVFTSLDWGGSYTKPAASS